MNIFILHIHIYQKASTIGEAQGNQVDKLTRPLDAHSAACLISHTRVGTLVQEMNSYCGSNERYARAPHYEFLLPKAKCPTLQQQVSSVQPSLVSANNELRF